MFLVEIYAPSVQSGMYPILPMHRYVVYQYVCMSVIHEHHLHIPFPAISTSRIANSLAQHRKSGATRNAVSLVTILHSNRLICSSVGCDAPSHKTSFNLYIQMDSNTFDRANEAVPETMLEYSRENLPLSSLYVSTAHETSVCLT